jgi:hypothetical protein
MDNLGDILESAKRLIESSKELNMELDEIKRCEEFLIEEYKRNKKYFRLEPGKTTVEDVIKTCFEFGWSSRRLFDIKKDYEKKNHEGQ